MEHTFSSWKGPGDVARSNDHIWNKVRVWEQNVVTNVVAVRWIGWISLVFITLFIGAQCEKSLWYICLIQNKR